MCNYLTNFLFLLLMIASFSVGAKNDVIKVYDKGLDGNARNYSIVCPNGKKTFISHVVGKLSTSRSIHTELEIPEESRDPDLDAQKTTETRKIPSLRSSSKKTNSVKDVTEDLKQKFRKLIGAKSRVNVCISRINMDKQCKSYESIDVAAKAACDLIR